MKKNYLFNMNMKQCMFLAIAFMCLLLTPLRKTVAQIIEPKPAVAWDYTIGGRNYDEVSDMKVLPNNDILVGARLESLLSSSYDYWIIKLNPEGNKIWDKVYGGNDHDYAETIVTTANGEIIVGGSSRSKVSRNKTSPNVGGFDYWVVKLDANGNKIWDKTYGGTGNDYFGELVVTSTGEIILTGTSFSGISGDKTQPKVAENDLWIIKLDANGNKVWDKTFGRVSQPTFGESLSITPQGDYIIGGSVVNTITDSDYRVLKINSTGTLLWDKVMVANSYDRIDELVVTSTGDIIIGGNSSSDAGFDKSSPNTSTDNHIWVVKLDALGNKILDKTIGSSGDDYFGGMLVTNTGDILLASHSNGGKSIHKTEGKIGEFDFWVVALDSIGEKKWDKTLGGTSTETMGEIIETANHDLIVGGSSSSNISGDKTQNSFGNSDCWIVKVIPQFKIKTFSPMDAPTGANITIKGKSFRLFNINSVQFNGREAVFTIVDDETIKATVPYGLTSLTGTGQIKLSNARHQVVKSIDIFTVIASTPLTLNSFSPTSGKSTTEVTILGAGFVRVDTVKFGSTPALFTVVNDSTITATVPYIIPNILQSIPIKVIYNNKIVLSQEKFQLIPTPYITAYPNPTTGLVTVSIREGGTFYVTSPNGWRIYEKALSPYEEHTVDLRGLANSNTIFFLDFLVNGVMTRKKFILE